MKASAIAAALSPRTCSHLAVALLHTLHRSRLHRLSPHTCCSTYARAVAAAAELEAIKQESRELRARIAAADAQLARKNEQVRQHDRCSSVALRKLRPSSARRHAVLLLPR